MTYEALANNVLQGVFDELDALPQDEYDAFVDYLKSQVEANWGSDTTVALQYADAIIAIGQHWHNDHAIALGTMARGDTLRLRGESEAAWDTLDQAATLFTEIGNDVGWARTWIGRLMLAFDLKKIDEALEQSEVAGKILDKAGEIDFLLRLENSIAFLYATQGKLHDALPVFLRAAAIAESIGEAAFPRLRHLYGNIGYVYTHLTHFDEAEIYYRKAYDLFERTNAPAMVAVTNLNLARIAEYRGHLVQAFQARLQAAEFAQEHNQQLSYITALYAIMRSQIQMNRYEDAIDYANRILSTANIDDLTLNKSNTLTLLAVAYANLGEHDKALSLLDDASLLYEQLDASLYIHVVKLYRARVFTIQSEYQLALEEALSCKTFFETQDRFYFGQALLLLGQCAFHEGAYDIVDAYARTLLTIARDENIPLLRYQAHLLLGQCYKSQSQQHRAIRHLQAANATINRVQQRLTMPLRSDFMRDKDLAFRELIGIYIANEQPRLAFELLERHKSRVFWSYLVQGNHLQWALEKPENQALHDKLNQLRAEHHYYYQELNQPFGNRKELTEERQVELRGIIAQHERDIRAITDRLYVQSHQRQNSVLRLPNLSDIQASLPDNTVLIEYFDDSDCIWAFTLTRDDFRIHSLPTDVSQIARLLQQWQLNVGSALKVGAQSPLSKQLARVGHRVLDTLYTMLIEPIQAMLHNATQVIIAPYGNLHFLPFHLLRHDQHYLIEDYEVSTIPAASLLLRDAPKRNGKARILAHSADGNLPATITEAQYVHQLFTGDLFVEKEATQDKLTQAPCSILHIAAHGEFRLDYPNLSFIELADGQINADDLLQQDMSYELVTLSACETARSSVVPGDELVGLGRGLLYAGAGTIVSNLWQADDETTSRVIFRFYDALIKGKRKSDALKEAFTSLLVDDPSLHPAFWGSLQLMGDTSALSSY